jgi:hypothetical protein
MIDRALADLVLRQPGDEVRLESISSECRRDVPLSPAEIDVQRIRLDEALKSRRRKPEHDLAEGDDFLHESIRDGVSVSGAAQKPSARGSQRLSSGTNVTIRRQTIMTMKSGNSGLMTDSILVFATPTPTKSTVPTGGVQRSNAEIEHHHDSEMNRIDAEFDRDGKEDRRER